MTTEQLREMLAAKVATDRARWDATRRKAAADGASQRAVRDEVLRHTRSATPDDYGRWLEKYFASGGEPTHFYDYTMPNSFRIAVMSFVLTPLYGANSLEIIVPASVQVSGAPGHTKVYRMDDPQARFVPIYSDTVLPR